MAESLAPNLSDIDANPEGNLSASEPLGIKNPLLGVSPLWQNVLMPKFLTPLGAKPLSVLDPSIFAPRDTTETAPLGQSFDTPFFAQPDIVAQPSPSVDPSAVRASRSATGGNQNLRGSRTNGFADRSSPRTSAPELIQARFQEGVTATSAAEEVYRPQVIQAFADPQASQTSSDATIASEFETPLSRESILSSQAPFVGSSSEATVSEARGDIDSMRSSPVDNVVQRTLDSIPTPSVPSELRRDVMAASSAEPGFLPASPALMQRSTSPMVQPTNPQETGGQLGQASGVTGNDGVAPSIDPEVIQRRVLDPSNSTQATASIIEQPVIQRSVSASADASESVLGSSMAANAVGSANNANTEFASVNTYGGTDSGVFPRSGISSPVVSSPSVSEASVFESSPPDLAPNTTVVQAQRDLNVPSVAASTGSSLDLGSIQVSPRSPEPAGYENLGYSNPGGISAGSDLSEAGRAAPREVGFAAAPLERSASSVNDGAIQLQAKAADPTTSGDAAIGQQAFSEPTTLFGAGIPNIISSQTGNSAASVSTPRVVQRWVEAAPSVSPSSQINSEAQGTSAEVQPQVIQPKFVAEASSVSQSETIASQPVTAISMGGSVGAPLIQAQRETSFALPGDGSEGIVSPVAASASASENSPEIQLQSATSPILSDSTEVRVQPKLAIPASESATASTVSPTAFAETTESGFKNVAADRPSEPTVGSSAPIPLDAMGAATASVLQAKGDDSAKLGDVPGDAPPRSSESKSSEPGPFQSALNLLKPFTRLFQPATRSPQSTSESSNLAGVENQAQSTNPTISNAVPAIQAKRSPEATSGTNAWTSGISTPPDLTSSFPTANGTTPTSSASAVPIPLTSVPTDGSPVIQAATDQDTSLLQRSDLSSGVAEASEIAVPSLDRPTPSFTSPLADSQPTSGSAFERPFQPTLLGDGPSATQNPLPFTTTAPSPVVEAIQRAPLSSLGGDAGLVDGAVQNQPIATSSPSDLDTSSMSAPLAGISSGASAFSSSNPIGAEAVSFNPVSQVQELGEAVSIPVQLRVDTSASQPLPLTSGIFGNESVETEPAEMTVPNAAVFPMQRQVDASIPQITPLSAGDFTHDRTENIATNAAASMNQAEQELASIPVQRRAESFALQPMPLDSATAPQGLTESNVSDAGITPAMTADRVGQELLPDPVQEQVAGFIPQALSSPVQRQVDSASPVITPVPINLGDAHSSGSTPAIDSPSIQREKADPEVAIDATQAPAIAPLSAVLPQPMQRAIDDSSMPSSEFSRESSPETAIVPDLFGQRQSNPLDADGFSVNAVSSVETSSVAPIQRRTMASEAVERESSFSPGLAAFAAPSPAVQDPGTTPQTPVLSEAVANQSIVGDRVPNVSSDMSQDMGYVQPSLLQRRSDGQLPEAQSAIEPIGATESVPRISTNSDGNSPIIQARLATDKTRISELPLSSTEPIDSFPSMAPANSSPIGSQEITSSPSPANSVLQAFTDSTAIPQLPTVLENLSVLQPLTTPSGFNANPPLSAAGNSLIQARFLTESRDASPDILSGEDTVNSPDVLRVPVSTPTGAPTNGNGDRFSSSPSSLIPITDLAPSTPPIQRRAAPPSTSFNSLPDSWSSMDELLAATPDRGLTSTNGYDPLPLPKQPKLSSTVQNSASNGVIQAFPDPNASPIQRVEAEAQTGDDSDEAEPTEEDLRNLEVLAREIYGLVRQKLEIERERGGAYYSGRRPW